MHSATAPGLVLHLFFFVILSATRTALGAETITASHGTLLISQREHSPSQVGALSLRSFSFQIGVESAAGNGLNLMSPAAQLVASSIENRPSVIPSLTVPPTVSDFQMTLGALETFEPNEIIEVAPVPEASTWLGAALAALLVLLKLRKRRHAFRPIPAL